MGARILTAILFHTLFVGCATVQSADRVTVTSAKTGVVISFEPPRGWEGPGHGTWPSYENWSFSRDSCYISLRVDPARPDSARKARAALNDSDAIVTQSLRKNWQNPTSETLGFVEVSERRVRIRAAHHVDGDQAWGVLLAGRSDINFELSADTAEQLSRYTSTFLSFVRSVRLKRAP